MSEARLTDMVCAIDMKLRSLEARVDAIEKLTASAEKVSRVLAVGECATCDSIAAKLQESERQIDAEKAQMLHLGKELSIKDSQLFEQSLILGDVRVQRDKDKQRIIDLEKALQCSESFKEMYLEAVNSLGEEVNKQAARIEELEDSLNALINLTDDYRKQITALGNQLAAANVDLKIRADQVLMARGRVDELEASLAQHAEAINQRDSELAKYAKYVGQLQAAHEIDEGMLKQQAAIIRELNDKLGSRSVAQ